MPRRLTTSRRARPCEAGMTLVELAVVMAVIAVLLSIGVGAYLRAQQGLREDAMLSSLEGAVREARQLALMNRAEARLEIDAAGRRVRPVGLNTVAFFHLEGAKSPGAFGYAVELEGAGARYSTEGHTGSCVELAGSEAAVSLGAAGAYALEEGGEISLWCWAERRDRRQVLLQKGEPDKPALLLEMDHLKGGRLHAVLEAEHETWHVRTDDFRMPLRRWVKIALRWHEAGIEIRADDVVRAREVTTGFRPKLPPGEPLRVSDEKHSFEGRVDEIAVRRLFRGAARELPENYRLISDVRRLQFRPDGSLDRSVHAQPVRLGLTRRVAGEEKPPRTFTVSLAGRVE